MTTKLLKPWQYKNKWLVWPETIFDSIETIDCDSTLNGICLSGQTLEQCIEECKNGCAHGYHIQFENGQSICAPIQKSNYKHKNLVHRLRNKSIYNPILNNVKVSSFINTDIFPFPPDQANIVFYTDILSLKDYKTGYTVGTKDNTIKVRDKIYLDKDKDKDHNIQILPSKISDSKVVKYQPICYGDNIQILIPSTTLFARESNSNSLMWESSSGMFHGDDMSFRILPIGNERKIGDILTYDDIFKIQYTDGSLVIVNPNYNYLELKYIQPKNETYNYKFQFISKMIGYYCDGKESKPIPIKDIETSGKTGRYKGVTVCRDKECWGICDYLISGTNQKIPYSDSPPPSKHNYTHIILSIIFLIILSISFYMFNL